MSVNTDPTAEYAAVNDLLSAALARAEARREPVYVFCTTTQWVLGTRPPDFRRQHFRVEPSPGRVVRWWWDHERQAAMERVLWPQVGEDVEVPV